MVLSLVAGCVVLLVALAAAARRRDRAQAPATVLRWVALALTAVLCAVLAPDAVSDAGWFTAVLFGVPAALAVVPVLAEVLGRGVAPATTVSAVLMLGWGLLLGLGLGVYFVLPAILLGVAAVVSAGTGRAAARTSPPAA